jgi:hypothetical protein
MSEQLNTSLVFLTSVIGLYALMLLVNEALKSFVYILSFFKRKEDEKLVKELISALNKKDSNG